jgi:hypothetical protein
VLDPTAAPGLAAADGASLSVQGRVVVNALANPAATAANGAVQAGDYQVVGSGVSGRFTLSPSSSGSLALGHTSAPDPLITLPTPATTPSVANNTATPLGAAWNTQDLGSPVIQGDQATGLVSPNGVDARGIVQLFPGVYRSIQIGGGTVNFNPGVYILSPASSLAYSLDVTGGNVGGAGVMFYNTGGDFVPSTGYPDNNDARWYDPGPSGTNAPPATQGFQGNFAGIRIDGSRAEVALSALQGPRDPFNGVLIYQRRANTQGLTITGGNLALAGTIYAKWARLEISGAGTFSAQFIVGSMQVSGSDTVTLTGGASFARASKVFLVE